MAIKKDKIFAKALRRRADAYEKLGRSEEARFDRERARVLFDQMIEKNPRIADQFLSRGRLSQAEGKYAAALEDYGRALSLTPNDVNAYCWCGDTHVEMGEYDQALKDYEKALEQNPRHGMSFIGRGDVYKKVGDVKKAINEYERCLAVVDGNHFVAKKRLEECHSLLLKEEELEGHLKIQTDLLQVLKDREALEARERMLRDQFELMDERRVNELLKERIRLKKEIIEKVQSSGTKSDGGSMEEDIGKMKRTSIIDCLRREVEELEKGVEMFEYLLRGGGKSKEKVLQSQLDESEKTRLEAMNESIRVFCGEDIMSFDAMSVGGASSSSSMIRCGNCVMYDGSSMRVNVRCLSGRDQDEIGMWWNVQTHPNIHRLFGIVRYEGDESSIKRMFSHLSLQDTSDSSLTPAGSKGEMNEESISSQKAFSVALCEWKRKSLRMFLEERYDESSVHGGGGLSFEEIVNILLDVSRGLQHLHHRGYVHGNVTSHSILVEHSSQYDRHYAVLSDVGLWNRDGIDMSGGRGGGVSVSDGIRWMAPELLSQEDEDEDEDEDEYGDEGMVGTYRSYESDVWSFGMVMHEMLTGKIPFSSKKSLISVIIALGRGERIKDDSDGYELSHPLYCDLMKACVSYHPPNRPLMTRVIQVLEEMQ
eukprot:TRINITY_DN934_c0_g1_i4.p1 TRINITY_DN934_c0_g1~~TRINITY_DN934_c0_g1_i4.p1  ORF type:complete len:650 (+),score=265.62 TRINITY_DN934_c0_g1_i4:258-2207(+)